MEPTYRLIQKTFRYEQLGKRFRIEEGEIVGIVQSTIESDLSMTIVFVVKEF